MSVQSVPQIRDYLFHPLSEKHSCKEKLISVITDIALTILTVGAFFAVFIGVNIYDHFKAKKIEVKTDKPDESESVSLKELKKHNTVTDCWIAIHGRIYDVTSFLEDHPGGDDVLLDCAGMDATDAFENIGHSPEAIEQMEDYYIRDL